MKVDGCFGLIKKKVEKFSLFLKITFFFCLDSNSCTMLMVDTKKNSKIGTYFSLFESCYKILASTNICFFQRGLSSNRIDFYFDALKVLGNRKPVVY